MVLHSLDHRLVRTHRVDAAAYNLYYTRIAILENLVNLGLDSTSLVGDVGILGDDALGKLFGVDAKREGRAALKVEAEAELLLHRRRNVERNDCNEQQNKPFPDVVANSRFLGHSLSNPFFEKLREDYTKISVRSPAARQYGPKSQNQRPFRAFRSTTSEKYPTTAARTAP